MARRKSSRRRRFNLRKVRVAASVGVGALAAGDLIAAAITAAAADSIRIVTADLAYSMADLGATADDGQEIGLAHSDYSAAEIEECLESSTSIDLGDKIAQERANRLVRTLGQLHDSTGTGAGLDFNNGQPLKVRLNWVLSAGDTLNIWVRNGSSVVYTTGASIVAIGNLWVKDSV